MGIKILKKKENEYNIKITDCDSGISFNHYNEMPFVSFKSKKTEKFNIYFFYKRTELKNCNENDFFNTDGNPLLYALKQHKQKGYFIDNENKKCFFEKIQKTTKHYKSFFEKFDTIILIPTSNKILYEMVCVLNEINKNPIYNNILVKKKNIEIDINTIRSGQKKFILNNPDKDFEIKKIPKKYRKSINHLKINDSFINENDLENNKIILIDDSITSGNSFRVAYEELKKNKINCTSFSFFGNRDDENKLKQKKSKTKRDRNKMYESLKKRNKKRNKK